MLDWWYNEKKRLPKNIAAWENWLRYSKPDTKLLAERTHQSQVERTQVMLDRAAATPTARPETLQRLRAMKEQLHTKLTHAKDKT